MIVNVAYLPLLQMTNEQEIACESKYKENYPLCLETKVKLAEGTVRVADMDVEGGEAKKTDPVRAQIVWVKIRGK